jgi:AraC-like DNA-binding protein
VTTDRSIHQTRRPRPRPDEGEPSYFSTQISDARRFYLNLNPGSKRALEVVSGGLEHCRPDYEIKRSTFPYPTIEFVARGAGHLLLSGRSWELTPGTVFVYGPRIPHQITTDPRNALTKYFVVASGEQTVDLLHEWQLDPGCVVRTAHPEQVQQIFDDLIRHGLGDRAARARVCAWVLQYLILKIGDSVVSSGATMSDAYATYERCRCFIEDNFGRVSTLQEVGAACHVDLAYMCRLFQRFGRESPFQYLQHLRMSRAAEMLHAGRLVKDVADELGFSEPCNFSRAFQRFFGLPPSRVRHPRHAALD